MKKLLYLQLFFLFVTPLFSQLTNQVYKKSACGLNFIHNAIKVTNRTGAGDLPGNAMPVTFNITSLPANCYQIEAAYVWWIVSYKSGSPTNPIVTVTDPANNTRTFNSTMTGQDIDKCWIELGTRGFRANIGAAIVGNGNYRISVSTNQWETDGITLLIIYRDLKANYEGHFIIRDGIVTKGSGSVTDSITGFTACDNSTYARAFMIASDLQRTGVSAPLDLTLNGVTNTYTRDFWNSEVVSTNVTKNQMISQFGISAGGDCYSWIMMGLYYRTTTCKQCPDRITITASPKIRSICRGASVTLNASGGASYQWTSIPPGFTSSQQSPTVSPVVTTRYIVRGTDANGCLEGYDTVRIVVNQPPVAHAGPDKSVCSGDPVQIGSDASGGTAPYSYVWTPAAGLSDNQIAQPIANPPNTTTYVVTVTDANGCTDKDTVVVNIFPRPNIDAGPDKSVCSGDPIQIGSNASGGTAPYSYVWSPTAGLSDNQIAQPIANPLNTTTYVVTVTDANGCTDKDTIVVTVSPRPDIDAGPDKITCEGVPVQIGDEATGGTQPYTYQWTPAGGLSADNIAQPSASPNDTTTYIVTVTDANGCDRSDTVVVNVYPSPNAIAGNDAAICYGKSVIIGNDASGGTPPYTYQWTPATGLSADNISTPEANPTTTTQYIVSVTDANGCVSLDTIVVSVNSLPIPDAGQDSEICFSDNTQIGNDASGGSPPYTYQWTPAAGLSADNVSTPNASPGTTTQYIITVTDVNGCVNWDTVLVTVFPLPEPEITPSGPTTFCTCDSVLLDAGSGFISYEWSTSETTQVITVHESGTYTVTVIDTNGCQNSSDPLEITVIEPTATIALPERIVTADPGDTVRMPLVIKTSENLDFCNSWDYTAVVSFNKSLLVPIGSTPGGTITNRIRTIEINGNRTQNDSILTILEFFATLGDDSLTDVSIDSFVWNDCGFDVITLDSIFALTGLCHEGGVTRLFITDQSEGIISVYPNPFNNTAEVKFLLAESGYARLFVSDILGRKAISLFNNNADKGSHTASFEADGLPAGIYFIILETKNKTYSKIVEIEK